MFVQEMYTLIAVALGGLSGGRVELASALLCRRRVLPWREGISVEVREGCMAACVVAQVSWRRKAGVERQRGERSRQVQHLAEWG